MAATLELTHPVRSQIIAQAMRMVVPMRHVYSCNIDIERILADSAYAHSIVHMAGGSTDERLRSHARKLGELLFSAARPSAPRETAAVDAIQARYTAGLR